MLGLYFHIPFCNHICNYCDFYKMVVSEKFKEKYINYLIKEIEIRKLKNFDFDTIYIGGGTPSCLSLSLLETLLQEINKNINMNNVKEFSIEVNPEDITPSLLDIIIKYKINRISIGIESFSEKKLKVLGRHFFTFDEIKQKINLIKNYGINNISCDLIYGIFNENLNDVLNDVDNLINLDIPHISTYSLILEEKTIFYEKYKKNEFSLINEELDEKMYKSICTKLKKNGFIHYETSNFGKTGFFSNHNLKYWNGDEYIGIGAAASSYFNHQRFTNVRNINLYYEGIDNNNFNYVDFEALSIEDEKDEMIMLSLRKSEGINKNVFFKKFNQNIKEAYNNINKIILEGLLEENNDFIYIPEKYSYIANHIIIKII